MRSHLQCFANRVRAGHFRSLQTDGAPPSIPDRLLQSLYALNTCTGHAPLEYAFGTHLQCFATRVHAGLFCTVSTNGAPHSVYSPQTKQSTRPLYEHHSASAVSLMHQTSCATLIYSEISPPMLCHFRTLQTDGVPHSVYSPFLRLRSNLLDLYTNAIRRQPLASCIRHHAPL